MTETAIGDNPADRILKIICRESEESKAKGRWVTGLHVKLKNEGLGISQVRKGLNSLLEAGKIVKQGKAGGTHWKPSDEARHAYLEGLDKRAEVGGHQDTIKVERPPEKDILGEIDRRIAEMDQKAAEARGAAVEAEEAKQALVAVRDRFVEARDEIYSLLGLL